MRCGPLPLPLLLLLAAQLLLARTCGCASGREYPSRPGLDLRHAHLLLSQKARFFQHSGGAVVYSSGADELPGWDEEALEGPHARSRVGLAETFRRPGTGDFEFVLVWPELSLGGRVAHNRWRQSSNPVTTHHVSGYVPLDVLAPATLESGDRRAEPFGGLAKGSYVCLLRTPGHDSSSFCVGANNAYSQNQRRDAPGWWPGFQVSHKERQERVTWTELWVVNAKGQAPAPQPPPLPPQPPPLAEEGDMPVFDGFDVVLVIGQSNAVGYGPADSPEWRANEDTSGLPVYVLHAATQARQHLFNGPMLSRAQQNVRHIPTSFGSMGVRAACLRRCSPASLWPRR